MCAAALLADSAGYVREKGREDAGGGGTVAAQALDGVTGDCLDAERRLFRHGAQWSRRVYKDEDILAG